MTTIRTIPEGFRLTEGAHQNFERGACLLELASYLSGRGFTDHPQCVSPVLGAFGRSFNDMLPDEPRQRLIPYAARMLDTAGDGADERRSWMATDWLVRTYAPAWLDLAGLTARASELRACDELVDSESFARADGVLQQAKKEAAAAGDAARDAAWAAAGAAAAGAAAWDAAGAAAWAAAWDAARDAAGAAARDAAWAAARDAAWAAAGAAAEKKLAPTVAQLQNSAFELLDRMIEAGKVAA
jgi:hypothetical protein